MKIICLSILYNKFSILEKSLNKFFSQCKHKEIKHFIIDNNYPLENNSNQISKLSEKLDIEYINFNRNLGLFNTIDYFCQKESDDTLIIVNESNSYVNDYGFDEALVMSYNVLKKPDDEIVISIDNDNSNNLKILEKNGILYSIENDGIQKDGSFLKGYPYSGINIASSYFLKEVNAMIRNKYYGDPYRDFIRKNRVGYILKSHKEISDFFYDQEDEIYKIYKMIVLYLDYKKSFEDYLKLHNENIEYTTMLISMLYKMNPEIIKYIKYDKDNLNKI